MKKLILILLLLACGRAEAFVPIARLAVGNIGNYWFINATNGSDSGGGHSAATALLTTSNLVARKFLPGDMILLKANDVYTNVIVFTNSGQPLRPITFDWYGASITAANPIIDGSFQGQICHSITSQTNIRVLHLDATKGNPDCFFITGSPTAPASNVVYLYCNATGAVGGNGNGFHEDGVSYSVVGNFSAGLCGDHSLSLHSNAWCFAYNGYLYSDVKSAVENISNSIFIGSNLTGINCTNWGFEQDTGPGFMSLTNCDAIGNLSGGYAAQAGSGMTCDHCHAESNWGAAFTCNGGAPSSCNNCTVFSNAVSGFLCEGGGILTVISNTIGGQTPWSTIIASTAGMVSNFYEHDIANAGIESQGHSLVVGQLVEGTSGANEYGYRVTSTGAGISTNLNSTYNGSSNFCVRCDAFAAYLTNIVMTGGATANYTGTGGVWGNSISSDSSLPSGNGDILSAAMLSQFESITPGAAGYLLPLTMGAAYQGGANVVGVPFYYNGVAAASPFNIGAFGGHF
ncbi:MAG TPA: hypothetical protein VGO59_07180 [Verrucomicrobiae bacterium]|jgi:hypothetical protein